MDTGSEEQAAEKRGAVRTTVFVDLDEDSSSAEKPTDQARDR